MSNPASPTLRGSYNTSGAAYDIQLLGDLAYVSDDTGGLLILDVADPAAPSVRGNYLPAGRAQQSWVEGNLAYVVAGKDGLRIIDLSRPTHPRVVGSLRLPGTITNIAVVDDPAYLCDLELGKLHIVDIGDTTNPTLLGTYDTAQNATNVELVGTLAYVSEGSGGLEIVDVSDPAIPTHHGGIGTNGFAGSLDIGRQPRLYCQPV